MTFFSFYEPYLLQGELLERYGGHFICLLENSPSILAFTKFTNLNTILRFTKYTEICGIDSYILDSNKNAYSNFGVILYE